MESRFDEIEIMHIEDVPVVAPVDRKVLRREPMIVDEAPAEASEGLPLLAARWRRSAAFLIDCSLFVAAGLVMTPLLPDRGDILSLIETEALAVFGLVGFLTLVSFYYFFGAWLIWGRTVGGAILDVRVISADGTPLDAISVSKRWAVTMLSVATGFVLFAPALLPGRRTVADRVSDTLCIAD